MFCSLRDKLILGASFTMVSRCLQSSEDVTVQHIAAKIIENIATTAGRYCKKFLVKDVGQVKPLILCQVYVCSN